MSEKKLSLMLHSLLQVVLEGVKRVPKKHHIVNLRNIIPGSKGQSITWAAKFMELVS